MGCSGPHTRQKLCQARRFSAVAGWYLSLCPAATHQCISRHASHNGDDLSPWSVPSGFIYASQLPCSRGCPPWSGSIGLLLSPQPASTYRLQRIPSPATCRCHVHHFVAAVVNAFSATTCACDLALARRPSEGRGQCGCRREGANTGPPPEDCGHRSLATARCRMLEAAFADHARESSRSAYRFLIHIGGVLCRKATRTYVSLSCATTAAFAFARPLLRVEARRKLQARAKALLTLCAYRMA